MARITSYVELFGGMEVDPVVDPYAVYRRLRTDSPVLRVSGAGTKSTLITRYRDVDAALRDDTTFSNQANARGIGLVLGRTIVEMDGPEHLAHRKIIRPALAPRNLRGAFLDKVDGIVHSLIDTFASQGSADLVKQFTFTYPLRVFTEILGLPVADYARFHRWAIDLTRVGSDPARGMAAAKHMAQYLLPILERRLAAPADDLLSALVHGCVDGEQMSTEEVISFTQLLVIGGAETTYHLTGSVLHALLSQPDLLQRVREDRELVQAALDEALRWESPVQLVHRNTTREVEVAGVTIPAGKHVTLALGSANRDPDMFTEPDLFDLDRGSQQTHRAFGYGQHFCAGSRLAYAEARGALNALLDRLDNLRLAPGTVCPIVGLAFRGPQCLPVRFDPG